jgi:F420H(2)-dependent quinone reductase
VRDERLRESRPRAQALLARATGGFTAMKAIKPLALALFGYVALVVAFECFVGFMGRSDAKRGREPGDSFLVITTRGSNGATSDTVVAGVESGGRLYVSANHWPRAWYERALASPEVEVARGGVKAPYRAVPIAGDELASVGREYRLPLFLRALTGFPPRRFLRLDPR